MSKTTDKNNAPDEKKEEAPPAPKEATESAVEATEAPQKKAEPASPPPSPPSRAPLLLSIIAILGLIGGLAAGYHYLQVSQLSMGQVSEVVNRTEEAWKKLQARLEKEQAELQARVEKQQADLQARIEKDEADLLARVEKDQADLLTRLEKEQMRLQTRLEEGISKVEAGYRAIEEQRSMVAAQKAGFENQKRLLEEQRIALQQREKEMRKELEAVHRRIGRSGSQWIASEAEYLISVANHRLRLERDIRTALAALQEADARLQATNDPIWTPVREALSAEMIELATLAKLDITGKSAAIANLIKRVGGLKLAKAKPLTVMGKEWDRGQEKFSAKKAVGETLTGFAAIWHKGWEGFEALLEKGWEGFKSMVVIRRRDEPVTAMLPPEQRYFVYQNLRLQLEAARIALLRADPDLYSSSLATTERWIKEFIVQDDPATQTMLEEITALKKVDVRPALPDISGSLRLLRERMKTIGAESIAP